VTRTRPTRRPASPTAALVGAAAYLAALALVLAVPLVFDSSAFDAFRDPKRALALAAWGVLAAIFLVWAGVVAGGVVSAVASAEPARAAANLVPLVLAALGWGALRQLSDERRRSLARLVVWAGVIEAALVLLYLLPQWRPDTFDRPDAAARFDWVGTLGNPGDVATFLAIPALLAAGRAVAPGKRRWFWAGAAAFTAAVLLGTRTVTGALALAAGVLVLAWRAVPRSRRLPAVAAIAVLAGVVFLATPLANRVSAAVNEARHGGLIWMGSARGAAYAAAGSMIAARPVTGVGFGLFEANSFRFQSEEALADRGRVLGLITGFGEAHDDPLQYAAETGILGVLLAAAGIALALRRRDGRAAGAPVDPAPLAAAALVLALTQFPLHLAAVAAQWVVVAALAVSPLPAPPETAGWSSRLRLLAIGVLIGATVAVSWQRYRATVAMQQGRVLVETLRISPMRRDAKIELARAAFANLQRRVRWLPDSWEAAVTLGNVAAAAGETAAALDSFGRALALADRPEVRFDVGMTMLAAGNHQEGMTQLVRAVHLNPAIFREVHDAALARELRGRLDASGYGARNAWMYEGTPAEQQ